MGTDAAPVPFFCRGTWHIRRNILSAAGKAGHGSRIMGVHFRYAALRAARLCNLQQNARGEIPVGGRQVGNIDPEAADILPDQYIL